jgi:hypothetical protein
MQLDCHPIPIGLMHNQVKHKVKLQKKRRELVKCTGACLDPKSMLVSLHLVLVDHHTRPNFAPLEFPTPASRDLAYMHNMS